jgi:hypothetical protein
MVNGFGALATERTQTIIIETVTMELFGRPTSPLNCQPEEKSVFVGSLNLP